MTPNGLLLQPEGQVALMKPLVMKRRLMSSVSRGYGKSQEGEHHLLGFFGAVMGLPEAILSKYYFLDSR
ncbi:hypothetical protein IAE55_12335 [Paenibacillus sp. S28]|nr:hypothetical protein [Paenibacillus sp. S28]